MAIAASDIQFRYSGGASNTDPDACLGGAISTDASGVVDDSVKNDLFDDVSSSEATAGDTEYRGIYIKNAHATLTLQDARIYISAVSSETDDVIDIAVADEAVSTTMETITDESTAPTGPTFSAPTDYAGGLALNSTTGLAAGAYKGVWVRRTTSASAASGSISNTLKVEGQTA